MIAKLLYAPPFLAFAVFAALPIPFEQWVLLGVCFVLSAIAGIGAAFRAGRRTYSYAATAILNSGSFGFAISAFLTHLEWPPLMVVFACVLAGLSGNMALELTLVWLEDRLKKVLDK